MIFFYLRFSHILYVYSTRNLFSATYKLEHTNYLRKSDFHSCYCLEDYVLTSFCYIHICSFSYVL